MENWQKAVAAVLDDVVVDVDGELRFAGVSEEELDELILYVHQQLGGEAEDAVNYVGKCCAQAQQHSRKRAAKKTLMVLVVPFILIAPIILISLMDLFGLIHLDPTSDLQMVLSILLPWAAEYVIFRMIRRRKRQTPEYRARMLWRQRAQGVTDALNQIAALF